MKISQAAKYAELAVKTVRYYADIGLVLPIHRSDAGYRVYDENAVLQLRFVRRARGFGFSIEDCRALLSLYQNTHRYSAEVKQIAMARLSEIKTKQSELQALHDDLLVLVEGCQGNKEPNCPIIARLGGEA